MVKKTKKNDIILDISTKVIMEWKHRLTVKSRSVIMILQEMKRSIFALGINVGRRDEWQQ